MRDLMRKWFGLRCVVLFCPGEIINSKLVGGAVYWRCTICGKHTQPR